MNVHLSQALKGYVSSRHSSELEEFPVNDIRADLMVKSLVKVVILCCAHFKVSLLPVVVNGSVSR